MDGKVLARIGAIMFLAVAITATMIELSRRDDSSAPPPTGSVESERDPLQDELRRCQQLGEVAANDAACLRIWAQTRDRFLGRASPPKTLPSSERW